jgi:Zinc carboxypeptidase
MKLNLKNNVSALLILFLFLLSGTAFSAVENSVYINYFIENGSPLDWEIEEDGNVSIQLLYDHERNSPNRACIHWNFLVEAEQGSEQVLVIKGFENIWNGQPGSAVSEETSCYLSPDGYSWKPVETEFLSGGALKVRVYMESDSMQVARLQPYRISDLDQLITGLLDNPLAEIIPIGKTVCNRELKVIRIGHEDAAHRIFLRGRAHPWEPGGNWVIEGLINSLLKNSENNQRPFLEEYCLYVLPMANMDGVSYGRTRFNAAGMDLNRKWDKPANAELAPENHAFEKYIESLIKQGLKPDLAIDFHNDESGGVHISRPDTVDLEEYLEKMKEFAEILRANTWFTEKVTGGEFRNPGSFGEGLLERYEVNALIFELNANWIAGLKKVPEAADWIQLGEDLSEVFYLYFQDDINK